MKTLVIDPGHGGSNTGTSDPSGRLIEKDLTLEISKRLFQAIHGIRWDVGAFMTRAIDKEVSLFARGWVSKNFAADFVYTIHANNLPGVEADGVRCFYWPGNPVGQAIAGAVANAFPQPLRQKTHAIQAANPGAQQNVLKYYKATAVLVEVGFLDDSEDLEALLDPIVLDGITAALLCGVAEARRLIP